MLKTLKDIKQKGHQMMSFYFATLTVFDNILSHISGDGVPGVTGIFDCIAIHKLFNTFTNLLPHLA